MFEMTSLLLHLSFISQNTRRNLDPLKCSDGSLSLEESLVVVATPPSCTDCSNEF